MRPVTLRAKEDEMKLAWLIERKDVLLCYSTTKTVCRWVTFTDPDAWRFDDQESADQVIKDHGLTDVYAVEHSWSDHSVSDPYFQTGCRCVIIANDNTAGTYCPVHGDQR